MTAQVIRLLGDPVLRTPASLVTDFDLELRRLVLNLEETMNTSGGVGLAAPQIGVGLRVFVWGIEGTAGHIVNPILTLGESIAEESEGCLSIPDIFASIPRAETSIACGFNVYGDPIVIHGSDLLSRCLQHEADHLDGVLFIDRLSEEARKNTMAKIRSSEWFSVDEIGKSIIIKQSPHS
jgi:peptide deformylase